MHLQLPRNHHKRFPRRRLRVNEPAAIIPVPVLRTTSARATMRSAPALVPKGRSPKGAPQRRVTPDPNRDPGVLMLAAINGPRYYFLGGRECTVDKGLSNPMILSFRDKESQKVFERKLSRKLPMDVRRIALRKLVMLNAAEGLQDLRIPPGNRLEALSGKRQGQHSIRINDQWRICFVWTEGGPAEVEIGDYH